MTELKTGKKTWFVLDELGSLQRLPQLTEAVTERRGLHHPVVLGVPRKAQMEAVYLAAAPMQPVKQSTVRKLPPPVAREADDRVLLLQVVEYYNDALKQSPEALKYLESRGLKSSEIIDRFKLGFSNRTLGYRLPAKNRAAGADMRGRLQKLGIYRESGHEHFNGSIVIPIFDGTGAVMGMYGRKITPNLREGTPDHLYLPGGTGACGTRRR